MKKIILSLFASMVCMGINAQVVKVYENGSLSAAYTNSSTNTIKVVFEESPATPVTDANLLPGKFTVAEGKSVQFTKSNVYWNGGVFLFEENQTDYQTSWSLGHVSQFYWRNLVEYKSNSYMPYSSSYKLGSYNKVFWCGEDNPLTIKGTTNLYALTIDEWNYLINSRPNASSLCKCGVTVTNAGTNYTNCLIIAPDDFEGSLKSYYETLDEVNTNGLVCLPAAGSRDGTSFGSDGTYGAYCTATFSDYTGDEGFSYYLYFSRTTINSVSWRQYNKFGRSLRLVRNL